MSQLALQSGFPLQGTLTPPLTAQSMIKGHQQGLERGVDQA